ncbi:MAG: hypothetical protein EBS53_15895 [Bacteroidetes bacterium]|nr:hypothetical protein [Bacteroidota bacterium]
MVWLVKATPNSRKYGPLAQLRLAKGLPAKNTPLPITKFTMPNWSVVRLWRSENTAVPVAVL